MSKKIRLMRKMATLAIVIGLVSPLFSYGQDSLEQYVEKAIENNPGIKAAHSEYKAALQQVPQVNTLPDPEVSAGYFISPVETRVGPQQAKLGGRQMFPWFGTLDAKEEAALQNAQSRFEKYINVREQLIYRVKQKWYKLYKIQTSIQITKEHLHILEQFESISTVKFETGHQSGKSGMVDVLRIKMEKEDLQNRLEQLQDEQRATQTAFNALLNKKEDARINVSDSLKSQTLAVRVQRIMDTMLVQHPTLTALEYEQETWEEKKRVAKKEGMPSLGVGVDYVLVGTPNTSPMGEGGPPLGRDAAMFPMVTLKLPIYRGKYKAQVQQTELKRKAVHEQYVDQQNQLRTMLAQAYRDYKQATRNITHYQQQIHKAQQAKDILMTHYQTAGQEFEEVLRMERQLLNYQLHLEKAIANQRTALAHMEYLYGKPF